MGSAITHTDDCKCDMLARLVENGVERFIDWKNDVSSFDGEKFAAISGLSLDEVKRLQAERSV